MMVTPLQGILHLLLAVHLFDALHIRISDDGAQQVISDAAAAIGT